MEKITKQELLNQGAIYIEHVLDGFDRYQHKNLKATYEEYAAYFLQLRKEHRLYADFYYSKITNENINIFKQALSIDQVQQLEVLYKECKGHGHDGTIIFSPSEEQLLLLLEISFKELLFSTFYVVDLPLTIWSNYNGEFVAFAKDENVLGGIICNY